MAAHDSYEKRSRRVLVALTSQRNESGEVAVGLASLDLGADDPEPGLTRGPDVVEDVIPEDLLFVGPCRLEATLWAARAYICVPR